MSIVKRVALGTAQLTLSNFLVRLISLISMPVMTHLLTPNAYGAAAMAATLTSVISVIALAGADLSYIRAYLAEQPAVRRAVETFTWRYAMASSILAAIVSMAFWGPISGVLSLPRYAGWLVGAGIFLSVAMTMATARARLHHRHHALSVATVAAGLGSTVAGIALAYLGWRDEFPLLIAMVAGYLIPVLILGLPPSSVLLKPSGLSRAAGRNILGIGFAGILTAPAYSVMTGSDRWFLGYYQDADAAGIYSVGYSVAIIGMTVNNAILTIWTPEATRVFEDRTPSGARQLAAITEGMIAVFACVWLAVTAAGGDIVRLLSAPAFHKGAMVVPFIAGAVFFHGITHLANTVYILEKRVHRTIWWWGAGAAACLLFNAMLVPLTGMFGAALSQLFAFMVVALGLSFNARRMFTGQISWTRVLLILVTVLAAAFVMTPAWSEKPLASLLLKFPVGLSITFILISYFGVASVLKAVTAKANITGSIGDGP